MVRARLAFLALAGSLLMTCGCVTTQQNECTSGGWFNRYRLASRTTPAPCECEGGMPITHGDGGMMVPPSTFVPPNAFMPPNGYVPPNAIAAPPPMIMTNPPGAQQAPRIVPIPQASPMPYTPQ